MMTGLASWRAMSRTTGTCCTSTPSTRRPGTRRSGCGVLACRAGEALGLRHEDIAAAEREIAIVPRENANQARAKSGPRVIPVGAGLIRLYADYLHAEYGGIDSSYVFVNLLAEPRGHAWPYPAVYDLVLRLRAKTGIDFDPHWFRSWPWRWPLRRRLSP